MFQINVPKRAAVCSFGGEAMVPGMEYYSALMFGEKEEHCHRRDYCPVCWDLINKEQGNQSLNSTWKSKVPLKKDLSDLPKKRDDRALYLLKEALILGNAVPEEEAFVLSLYLARRRKIYFRQEIKREGKAFSLYEVAETEEMLCVPKVELSQLQIGILQEALARKFLA